MTKTTLLVCALASLVATGMSTVLDQWEFDEPEGTPLSETRSTGVLRSEWIQSIDHAATDGQGNYVIRRPAEGVWNSFARIPVITAGGHNPRGILEVVIQGWNFQAQPSEILRIGFTSTAHPETPNIMAQIRIERTAPGTVVIAGDALGTDAEPIPEKFLGSDVQDFPVRLVLEVDKNTNTFRIHSQVADQPLELVGEGRISPERDGHFLRLSAAGHIGRPEEFVKISRITYKSGQ